LILSRDKALRGAERYRVLRDSIATLVVMLSTRGYIESRIECGSPLLKEEDHYTFRTILQEHWSIGMSMACPS